MTTIVFASLVDDTTVQRLTRAAKVRAMLETREDVQPRARVSFIVEDRDHDAEPLDTAAGCEFLDDRIRLLQ